MPSYRSLELLSVLQNRMIRAAIGIYFGYDSHISVSYPGIAHPNFGFQIELTKMMAQHRIFVK